MTVIEGLKVTEILVEAYLDGQELIVELTGSPVILVGLYSDRFTSDLLFADVATGHVHRNSEITIKGRKRGDLL